MSTRHFRTLLDLGPSGLSRVLERAAQLKRDRGRHETPLTGRSVVVLLDYVKPARYPAFTRFNLFLRDEFSCQYCGARGEMTFDHVVPRSRGGRTTWENVVAACGKCNLRKGNLTPRQAGMTLNRLPQRPTSSELQNKGRKFPPNHLHESWMDFLYWDAELDA